MTDHHDPADAVAEVGARVERLERRLLRERAARREAERIAERGMRDLWQANRDLEVRVADRTVELRQSLAAVTMAAQAKERFLAELGHELTTPLHAVLGLLGLIDAAALDDADRERLDDVRAHASQLSDLLRGLVDLAGAEGASNPEDIIERHPASWLDEVVASWMLPAAKRGQLLVPSVTGPGGSVALDWQRLRRIADAVLANVADHADAGGVSIDMTVEPGQVALVITDAGPGMSETAAAAAIEPFVSDGATAGIGTGLAVANRLAVGGLGSIDLSGDDGRTSVVIALPRARPGAAS